MLFASQTFSMDKLMVLGSKRFTTFLVVILIAFPLLVIVVTSIHRNTTSFGLFDGFSKSKALQIQNGGSNITTKTTTNGLLPNTTDENFGKERENNNNYTLPEVPKKGNIQNGTAIEGRATEVDSKSASPFTSESTTQAENLDEKLLDGLLPSGFDKPSCVSRFHSGEHRKPSPHKPSPHLISKLRNYEEIHRKCGPNSKHYSKNMARISHSNKNSARPMCKYLVWKPVNGLGNQMISIVATFLYAILTERVLLVRFGEDKNRLFCEPFLNSTWILPTSSPFWDHNHNAETYQSVLENSTKGFSPSALFLNLQYKGREAEFFFHCDHNQEILKKVPLLIIQSDQYFVPSLFMTPSLNTQLNRMFPEKDTVFHHLARYLFHPSNYVWGLISKFYDTNKLGESDEKIGIQVRVFSPNSTPHQAVMNLILNCTIRNKILPRLDSQSSMTSSARKKNHTSKAVIVTSLYPNYAEGLRDMYMRKNPSVGGDIIGIFQPSHEGQQKYGDNVQNMKAWMEMYLLSLCDVLVTTSLSTFGYVAQGLGGLKAWQLYKIVGNKTHFPPCERDFSMEPCYHAPPKHQCNGGSIKGFISSLHYVRECKDYCFGVKLFN